MFCALVMMSLASLVDFHFFIPVNAFVFFSAAGILCSPSFFKENSPLRHINIVIKAALLLLFAGALWLSCNKAMARRQVMLGKGLPGAERLEYYEKALAYYQSPRYALFLGVEYYNQSLTAADLEIKNLYRTRANNLAEEYLIKYPREKELSRLYLNSR